MEVQSQFRVRPMEQRDLPAWGELRCALWPNEDKRVLRKELTALLGVSSEYRGWIIIDNKGEAAGFAEASVRNLVDGCEIGPAAYLEAIWIAPKLRRKGLSRLLLGAIESWAKQQGLGQMGSDCSIQNDTSQAWHRAMGFSETGRSVNYRRSLR